MNTVLFASKFCENYKLVSELATTCKDTASRIQLELKYFIIS